ncbi:MBL fold metallo-hydrolase [Candidatus Woesearchaeota archaeon]|jgi:phosphoribosyl 1,2-cyclic phosphodiesterase|nr:MBL fold metallo-hydrolase [Candidatus Woesearchaeota archaeon]MBT7062693.1 MBL fold metallo-hydrolase [Candidatus Woesearchaeota archaeon]MBT7402474.1 MBL fold metallo-hydrolase [Candidatus Woesearchaeota archaeon]
MKEVNNRLVFIGTGGGRVVISNQARNAGGFVLQIPGVQMHIDPGPGALSGTARTKIRPAQTRVIISTHEHTDHANDINALIEAITLGGINKKGILISVPAVIDGTKEELPWLRNYYKSKLDEIFKIKTNDKVKLGDLTVTATKTQHDIDDCIGLRIEGPDVSIGYTSDTIYFKDLHKEFKDIAVLIINVLRPGSDKWKTHMCTGDAIKLIEEVKPELAIITHFGQKMLNANPLLEAREIQKRTGVRTIAADDRLEVNLEGIAQGRGVQTTL